MVAFDVTRYRKYTVKRTFVCCDFTPVFRVGEGNWKNTEWETRMENHSEMLQGLR